MDICFVPSLQHVASTKIVVSLFNKALKIVSVVNLGFPFEIYGLRCVEYKKFRRQIFRDIRKLTPITAFKKNLETYFAPLFCEFEQWLMNCSRNLIINDGTLFIIIDSIQHCWLADGTVDGEKLIKSLVKNSRIHRMNRFVLACTYCLYEDVLNLWELLSKKEVTYIKETACGNYVLTEWMMWLQRSSNKSRQSCVAWILGTSVWKDNMYMMKRALLSVIPSERSQFLLKVLISGGVSCDFIRFVLSLMTREEQELIFKEFPVEVFKCVTSWPLRKSFFDLADNFWPNLTVDTFCTILNWLLMQIQNQWDPEDFLVILRDFWTNSTPHFQNVAKNDPRFSEPLQLVLESDFTQAFLNSESFKCFRVCHLIY